MRVLFLSTLPVEGPSARPRLYAYEPHLRAAGIEPTYAPLLSSRAARRFYGLGPAARARRLVSAATGALLRLSRLLTAGRFDLVVVHRDALPRGNRLALALLRRARVPFVYDFDDAVYLAPADFVEEGQTSRRLMAGGKDPGEVTDLVEQAALVLAGNETLAAWARQRNPRVRVQPTPVDTALFRPGEDPPGDGPPRLGWIGSPTATYCITGIGPALSRAAAQRPFRLLVAGAGEPVAVDGIEVEQEPWTLEREGALYRSLDVGLYPLPDNAWTRGKCGYKALVYMACGVPPVVSPVGVNRDYVEHGVRGLHAGDDDDWVAGVTRLVADPDLRAAMGRAGREYVERTHAVDVLAAPLVDALREAAG